MDWSKIGKFLVDNQDDIKKVAENTAKAVKCANNLHEQHKKRKAEAKSSYVLESISSNKARVKMYNASGEVVEVMEFESDEPIKL